MKFVVGLIMVIVTASCGSKSRSLSSVKDEFSGRYFYYYDRLDRTKIIASLGEAVKAKYGLLVVKQARLGIDSDTLFKDAAAMEADISDVTDPFHQARSNLEFLDRTRRLIATFQDTHFWAKPTNPLPKIVNGLELGFIDGEVRIVTVQPSLLRLSAIRTGIDSIATLTCGDVVVSIDKMSPRDVAKDLSPYVNGSSRAWIDVAALEYVTKRAFRFPDQSHSEYVIRRGLTGQTLHLKLPYYFDYEGRLPRGDAKFYLGSVGIGDLNTLLSKTDKNFYLGHQKDAVPLNLEEKQKYVDADDPLETAFYTGYVRRENKTYAFLKTLSYNMDHVLAESEVVSIRRPYLQVIKEFIKDVKHRGVPLIIDQRYNKGGDGSYPSAILSMLARANETYRDRSISFRVTRMTRQMIEQNQDFGDEGGANVLGALNSALASGRSMTYEYSRSSGIKQDPDVDGFNQPVVALIGPECISACDIQSMLFKTSGRVTLVGEPSNGTGAGFKMASPFSDNFDVFRFSVPNFLFGFPLEGQILPENVTEWGFSHNSENRPTTPHISYHSEMNDLLNSDDGWIQIAVKTIAGSH